MDKYPAFLFPASLRLFPQLQAVSAGPHTTRPAAFGDRRCSHRLLPSTVRFDFQAICLWQKTTFFKNFPFIHKSSPNPFRQIAQIPFAPQILPRFPVITPRKTGVRHRDDKCSPIIRKKNPRKARLSDGFLLFFCQKY